jgi:hypothetical protein
MNKDIEKKNTDIINKYIAHEIKNSKLILGSPISMRGNPSFAPSKEIVNEVLSIDRNLLNKYPTNKFYASQGGGKGAAKYKKIGGAYKLRDSTIRFLQGGTSFDYKYKDPLKVEPDSLLGKVMKYIGQKVTKPIMKKMLGGSIIDDIKKGNDMRKKRAAEKMELKDEQMLEQKLNPLDKKELARRKVLGQLSEKQKMAYLRSARKKGIERYNEQEKEFAKKGEEDRRYRESRDWANVQKSDRQEALDERARLEQEARDKAEYEASKSWFDKFGEEALGLIPEAASLIPVKALQGPAKGLLKEGVNKMLGKGKSETLLKNSKLKGGKRKPSAWNIKVKAYMNKHNCSMKEALQKLKK